MECKYGAQLNVLRVLATLNDKTHSILSSPLNMFFTQSHQYAHDMLTIIGQLFYSRQCEHLLIKPRLFPLIAGPTGSGKSHLVERVASETQADYFKVTRGDWIPQGAKTARPTMYQIIDRAWSRERVLLHVDELDKFQIDFRAGDWGAGISSDLWNILDGKFSFLEYLRDSDFGANKPGIEDLRYKVRNNLWIVGSGTWQDLFSQSRKRATVGFQGSAAAASVDAHDIIQAGVIPSELLHRFNNDILFLKYPTPEETATLLVSTGLATIAKSQGVTLTPEMIYWNNGGIRALETIATRLSVDLYRKQKRNAKVPPDAPVKPINKMIRGLS